MLIKRIITEKIINRLWKGHILNIFGPRRVGKTTLVTEIADKFPEKSLYLNCDEPDIRASLATKTSTELKSLFGGKTLVVIDEAQRVINIGLTLKLIADTMPEVQVIATGSSSFDLSNRIAEPLTGRHRDFFLHPLSTEELYDINSKREEQRLLEKRLVYGFYPQVITAPDTAEETLRYIARDYLFKDVLEYRGIKNSDKLEKLIQALALQIGNEVSFNELSTLLEMDKKTVEQYVRILEQAFVIFRLPPFFRNRRKELTKMRKIYFWDTGIRNAVIGNFLSLEVRSDIGQLWENFLISERRKFLLNQQLDPKQYFWRTYRQEEVDLIEEETEKINGYEIKWRNKRRQAPKAWIDAYPEANWNQITRENYLDFVTLHPK
jgi:hypothetical protein